MRAVQVASEARDCNFGPVGAADCRAGDLEDHFLRGAALDVVAAGLGRSREGGAVSFLQTVDEAAGVDVLLLAVQRLGEGLSRAAPLRTGHFDCGAEVKSLLSAKDRVREVALVRRDVFVEADLAVAVAEAEHVAPHQAAAVVTEPVQPGLLVLEALVLEPPAAGPEAPLELLRVLEVGPVPAGVLEQRQRDVRENHLVTHDSGENIVSHDPGVPEEGLVLKSFLFEVVLHLESLDVAVEVESGLFEHFGESDGLDSLPAVRVVD